MTSADSSTFYWKLAIFVISRNKDIDRILIHRLGFFELFRVFRICFNKHGCNFYNVGKIG